MLTIRQWEEYAWIISHPDCIRSWGGSYLYSPITGHVYPLDLRDRVLSRLYRQGALGLSFIFAW